MANCPLKCDDGSTVDHPSRIIGEIFFESELFCDYFVYSVRKFIHNPSPKSDRIIRFAWIRLMRDLLYCYERVHLQFHSFLSMGELRSRAETDAETDRSGFVLFLNENFENFSNFQVTKIEQLCSKDSFRATG